MDHEIFALSDMKMPKAKCHDPSLGLATKAKGLQGCGPRLNL